MSGGPSPDQEPLCVSLSVDELSAIYSILSRHEHDYDEITKQVHEKIRIALYHHVTIEEMERIDTRDTN